ncbi:MAG: sigma-70 family RNA polymerase sigma factor [Gemmatimonadales bacterium]|nr:MAG: sigma-70 family RNA polymerase sigma factor [Gemmatimonadales bacterium]
MDEGESRPPLGPDREVASSRGPTPAAGAAAGPRGSLDAFALRLYEELRSIAHRQLRGERADHSLCTTALVHEAYLKLARLDRMEWQNRAHFCAEAARAMRRILVDYAVRRRAAKRGGDRVQVELHDSLALTDSQAEELLALQEALTTFEKEWPRQARVVECRFFAGMTIPEMAEALGIAEATVSRDWQLARAWLNRALATDTQ